MTDTLPNPCKEEEDFREPLKTSHIRHPKPHISADLKNLLYE